MAGSNSKISMNHEWTHSISIAIYELSSEDVRGKILHDYSWTDCCIGWLWIENSLWNSFSIDPCLTYPTVIKHDIKTPTIYRWFSKTAVFFGDCPRIFPYKELLVWIVWLGSRLSGKVQRNCEFKSGPGEWWLHVSWCTHSDSRIHPEKSLSFGDDCYHPSIVILGDGL